MKISPLLLRRPLVPIVIFYIVVLLTIESFCSCRDEQSTVGLEVPKSCLKASSGASSSGSKPNGFSSCVYRLRSASYKRLKLGVEENGEAVSVMGALILGYSRALCPETREVFRSTGTLHIFAISGMHVGIIAMLVVIVLKRVGVSRVYWVLYLSPVLFVYTFATGMKISAIRALIMIIVYYLAPLLKRKADIFSTCAFAALIILIFKPLQLFNAGFIYSFTVVLGILCLYPVFTSLFIRMLPQSRDDYKISACNGSDDKKGIVGVMEILGNYFGSLIAVSWAAWLVSMPLTAYFFGKVTVIALLSNILIIPLAFSIMLCGTLSLLLGSCIGFIAVVLNKVNVFLVVVMLKMLNLFAAIPNSSSEVLKPPLWSLLLWYTALILLSVLFRWKYIATSPAKMKR